MWQKNYDGSPILYLVPTPIGNMEDITFRAIRILREVEVIFSEDTRVTLNLLRYYQIDKRLISLHDHNEDSVKEKVLHFLQSGKNVALVTDRGTPVISDPGYKTVQYISNYDFRVVALPGACAFVSALIISGIPPQPFTFYGFLDSRLEKKKKELWNLKFVSHTLIFYEAPHRLLQTMRLMFEIFGNRGVSLVREISKTYESVYRGNMSSLLSTLENIKGEFVIIVEGYHEDQNFSELNLVEQVQFYIDQGVSKMDAIKMVAKERNMKKNDVYSEYHRSDV